MTVKANQYQNKVVIWYVVY